MIDGGTATGTTGIGVLNAGGSGAATLADGILVVQALNGGRTASGAFSLFAPVAAGAYSTSCSRAVSVPAPARTGTCVRRW